MERKKALEIMGLHEGATPDEITKRADILYKKYRNTDGSKGGYTFQDIENAYRTLSGITFSDENEEQKIKYRKEHPNPLFKLLKVDEEKARNFIYYHKWHAVIILVLLVIAGSMIFSMVNRVEPDLKVLITGELFLADSAPLEQSIVKDIPAVKAVQVQNVNLSETGDPQMVMAMQTKFTVEISAGNNDIFIVDEKTYKNLAKQGAFKPISEVLDQLGTLGIDKATHDDLKVALELEDGKTYSPELYGLDVSNSALLRDAGVVGDRLIVAMGTNGKYTQNAVAFLKLLLK